MQPNKIMLATERFAPRVLCLWLMNPPLIFLGCTASRWRTVRRHC